MTESRDSKHKILSESYMRLALVNMFVLMATNICGFIDNIVIGRFLGPAALAAVGFFSPVSVVAGMTFVVITGTGIISGSLIGQGRQEEVTSLFGASFLILTVFSTLLCMALIFAGAPLAALLGAKGEAALLLTDYMRGFAFSVVVSSLSSYMILLAPYNNEIRRSYAATAAMFFGNIILDILMARAMGIFGIGLASALSGLFSFLIILPGFLNTSHTIYLRKCRIPWTLVAEALKRGSFVLFFSGGMLVKNVLIIYTMVSFVGDMGVAIANVLASACGILGTVTGGFANAHSALSGVSYGEEDRESYVDLFYIALRRGLAWMGAIVVLTAVFSGALSELFFPGGGETAAFGRVMFLTGFWFFIPNLAMNLILNSYKVIGRMKLVNFLSFFGTAAVGVITLFSVYLFGVNAAWAANAFSDLIVLLIIIVSVFVWKKGICFSAEAVLKLPESFGAAREEYREYSLNAKDEVAVLSEDIMNFFGERGCDKKKAFWIALCVEEMTRNIFEHGMFTPGRNHIDVRVVHGERLTVCIKDDCQKFDPRERIGMYAPKDPEKNIGLRMVAAMAEHVDYYNNAGINSLIIKL